jgi:hypothetical protein
MSEDRVFAMPEELAPLLGWLKKHAVDVDALKPPRQVLYLAKRLGDQGKKMPKRSDDLFPHLLKIQRTLCPKPQSGAGKKQQRPEPYLPGTFGAASAVRRIDPSEYSKIMAGLNDKA